MVEWVGGSALGLILWPRQAILTAAHMTFVKNRASFYQRNPTLAGEVFRI
jgi:hypothetical protein